jgi:class 3 adenylate cyclase
LIHIICCENDYRDLRSKPLTQSQTVLAPDDVIAKHKPVITEAYLISYPDDLARIEEDLEDAKWIAPYLAPDVEPMEPVSDIFYPIMDNAHVRIGLMSDGYEPDERKVMAIFSLTVYWRDTIKDILPRGSNGLRVVFENPCNPTFTYEINGPSVLFLGAGDIHDAKYDHMAVNARLVDLNVDESTYSGLPLNEEFCPFNITLYPTNEREDANTTNTPLYFALVVFLIFVVTAATFIAYDYTVERRQKVVMMTAAKSSALVSSLFPDSVRDRVLPASESGEFKLDNTDSRRSRKVNMLSNNDATSDNKVDHRKVPVPVAKPIAELFPDTTVFSCDIAGFTAWSSTREPSAVFTLLETLYGAFDVSTQQHGIFKVETIGDTYIAVCGLPQPRKNHATDAARFALKCMDIMRDTTKALDQSLGRGTSDLTLRVGLHSGPTIAGE